MRLWNNNLSGYSKHDHSTKLFSFMISRDYIVDSERHMVTADEKDAEEKYRFYARALFLMVGLGYTIAQQSIM
jgi:hypothetical protein